MRRGADCEAAINSINERDVADLLNDTMGVNPRRSDEYNELHKRQQLAIVNCVLCHSIRKEACILADVVICTGLLGSTVSPTVDRLEDARLIDSFFEPSEFLPPEKRHEQQSSRRTLEPTARLKSIAEF